MFACFAARTNRSASTGVKNSASTSDVSSATAIVSASERKKTPVTPVSSASGRKTTTGVIVETMIGPVISAIASCTASRARLAARDVRVDVLDDDDRVVDHEADRRRHAAERHQIEAQPDEPHREERDEHRDRNDDRGHERRAPVAQEPVEDRRRRERGR